jgi:flagella basal body P-ring formation protein FlgA
VVTTPAKAEQDGKLGQVITVRNLESSAALKAQVIGPGSVRIP